MSCNKVEARASLPALEMLPDDGIGVRLRSTDNLARIRSTNITRECTARRRGKTCWKCNGKCKRAVPLSYVQISNTLQL